MEAVTQSPPHASKGHVSKFFVAYSVAVAVYLGQVVTLSVGALVGTLEGRLVGAA
jgi:hypothetical protein